MCSEGIPVSEMSDKMVKEGGEFRDVLRLWFVSVVQCVAIS